MGGQKWVSLQRVSRTRILFFLFVTRRGSMLKTLLLAIAALLVIAAVYITTTPSSAEHRGDQHWEFAWYVRATAM